RATVGTGASTGGRRRSLVPGEARQPVPTGAAQLRDWGRLGDVAGPALQPDLPMVRGRALRGPRLDRPVHRDDAPLQGAPRRAAGRGPAARSLANASNIATTPCSAESPAASAPITQAVTPPSLGNRM